MELENLARSMRRRIPWPVGQKILRSLQLARGQGWELTVGKLINAAVDEQKLSDMGDALKEHMLCGEKSVRFYETGQNGLDEARQALDGLDVPATRFAQIYPGILPEDELDGLSEAPTLTAVEHFDDGLACVFCSVRTLIVREELEPEQFPDANLDDLMDTYDEIIGLKRKRLQAVDVVWLPTGQGYSDIRIDFPLGMTSEAVEAAHELVRNAFNNLIGSPVLGQPVNLFPLIESMYFDPDEGAVVEIGFGTTTASLKLEKMRRRGLNLRTETYHQGGKASLDTPIEPFKVSIVWSRHIGEGQFSAPELSLNSNSRAANAPNPQLHSATVRKCMGLDDYLHVRSRIEHHLGNA